MRNWIFVVLVVGALACQTAQERRVDLLRDRVGKLSALSTFRPAWCRVDVHLTSPAAARYRELFPDDKEFSGEDLHYTWKARENRCEISSLQKGPAAKNYQSFLENALCLLMQVHWVNSPFDELKVQELEDDDQGRLHIRSPGDTPGLGLFIEPDPKSVVVETHTKSRGLLRAIYGETEGHWLPTSLEQQIKDTRFVVDQFEWSERAVGARRFPRSLWISLAEPAKDQARPHSQLHFSDCQVE
jgi:hypothetical protein